MSFRRVKALLLEEYYITLNSLEVIVDLFFLSVMSVIVFGYFSLFLSSRVDGPAANFLLLGMLLWEVVRVTQYSLTVGAMWEVWSRNITNLFITPLQLYEYLLAATISGFAKSVLILTTVSLISAAVFDFSLTSIGLPVLVMAFANLMLSGLAAGLFILGAIFRFGTRIQALAWGLIFLLQPITAVYFPLDTLPEAGQAVAKLLPPSYVFEMARNKLEGENPSAGDILVPFGLNLVYIALSLWFFNTMYAAARRHGQFAKLGT